MKMLFDTHLGRILLVIFAVAGTGSLEAQSGSTSPAGGISGPTPSSTKESSCSELREEASNFYTVVSQDDDNCEVIDLRNAEFVYQYTAYEFVEAEKGGIVIDPDDGPLVVNWLPFPTCRQRKDGCDFDIDGNGYPDILIAAAKGYRQGLPDTRAQPIVLENIEGILSFSSEISSTLPRIPGGRLVTVESQYLGKTLAFTAGGETVSNETARVEVNLSYGDVMALAPSPELEITEAILPDPLWQSSYDSGRKTGVRTHSLASGDLDGDGLEDILVGDYFKMFALMQTPDIQFELDYADYEGLLRRGPDNYLLTLDIHDMNGDGANDIVAGYSSPFPTVIYFNDGEGGFSEENSLTLELGYYGDQSSHLYSLIDDYDGDGDVDLVVNKVRFPYDGNYLQFYEQVNGEFIDSTDKFFGKPSDFADIATSWSDNPHAADVQGDGKTDIIRWERASAENGKPVVSLFLNDSNRFEETKVPLNPAGEPRPDGAVYWTENQYLQVAADDFDNDGLLEYLMLLPIRCWDCGPGGTEIVKHYFNVYELRSIDSNDNTSDYDRDDYLPGWADADGNCINTRHENLILESLVSPTMSATGCYVDSGEWDDSNTGKIFTDPSYVDIDHHVALAEAHRSGADAWPDEKKQQFANDTLNAVVLQVMDSVANSSKSDKDPAVWLPPNSAYHCQYVKNWVEVKKRYDLSYDSEEQRAIEEILGTSIKYGARSATIGVRASSGISEGRFSLGITNGQNCGYSSTGTLLESIKLDFEIVPAATDLNREVDILVVAVVGDNIYSISEGFELVPYNGNPMSLASFLPKTSFSQSREFEFLYTSFKNPIDVSLYLGYRKEDGDVVYSAQPFIVSVK
jgi:hypothetical protein